MLEHRPLQAKSKAGKQLSGRATRHLPWLPPTTHVDAI